MLVPPSDGLLEPVDDLLSRLRMLTGEGATHDDALQRLGHIQPGARERRVERQNAVLQQPAHHLVGQVPREIVPDQDQPQGGSRLGTFIGPPPVLPGLSQRMILGQRHADRQRFLLEVIEQGLQLFLQPGMQHRIGGRENTFGSHLSGCRAKQRQQFGRTPAHVLMGLDGRLVLRVPIGSWLGNGLLGSRLIFTHLHDPRRFRLLIGQLDQLFFSSALGSSTVTVPALRTRRAVPVGHQVRVLPKP